MHHWYVGNNPKARLNPILRSPYLSIVLNGFEEKQFFKYYNEATNMEYLYDPVNKLCFSFYVEDGDETILDLYGLGTWAAGLIEKKVSVAALANAYTIIGL